MRESNSDVLIWAPLSTHSTHSLFFVSSVLFVLLVSSVLFVLLVSSVLFGSFVLLVLFVLFVHSIHLCALSLVRVG